MEYHFYRKSKYSAHSSGCCYSTQIGYWTVFVYFAKIKKKRGRMRKNIKNEIIEATIKLIEEKGSNPADITIGEICDRVGVGVGLVNYHFQTKDNLIRQCVRRIIEDTIQNTDGKRLVLNEPTHKAKLRALLKINCEYLVKNKNISRISIQTDFINDDLRDNTQQTVDA
jgi:AcrR family transcriptional regulator